MPSELTLAERIRRYALDHYVEPARQARERAVTIRASDVHRGMGLTSRVPAVCGALGSALFQRFAGVTLLERLGPVQSTTTQFRYRLELLSEDVLRRRVLATVHRPMRRPVQLQGMPVDSETAAMDTLDAATSRRLYLVSCVKIKLSEPAAAKDLYVSDWFRKARTCVERKGGAWRILSAQYGLVHPDDVIRPYEKTLKTMRVADRRTWARDVLKALEPSLVEASIVVFFAGERYREFLEPSLRNRGIEVEVPMRGLSQGRQLAWLGDHLDG